MTIRFISEEQKAFFGEKVQKFGIARDPYRLALVYTLSLTENLRKHFNKCYNTSTRCICLDVFNSVWLTGILPSIIKSYQTSA